MGYIRASMQFTRAASIAIPSAAACVSVGVVTSAHGHVISIGIEELGRQPSAPLFAAGLAALCSFGMLAQRATKKNARDKPSRMHERETDWLPVPSYRYVTGQGRSGTSVSPELERLLGYARSDWFSNPNMWTLITYKDDRDRIEVERSVHLATGSRFFCEYRVTTRSGKILWVRDEAMLVCDPVTRSTFAHGVLIDITHQKETEDALRYQSLHDRLTDLPNRTLLLDKLEQALRCARRTADHVALLLMDLDRFKDVNDTFGHRYGDLLLRQVVSHLCRELGEWGTVARLGGDEFAILLPSADIAAAVRTAKRLIRVLSLPFEADGHLFDVGGSVGVVVYPDHGRNGSTLLQRADIAMYLAKRSESRYAVYNPADDPHSPERLALIRDLRTAIEADGLSLLFQPKINIRTGRTDRVEALVRWSHPQHGKVPPCELIALAEQSGLIRPLTLWVLNSALRQCFEWQVKGLNVCVAVNLSPPTLRSLGLVEDVENLLQKWGLETCNLEVEITETALMDDPVRAMETLSRLHTMGVSISIDDFGTGYSSLSYLTRVPADQIKIDKSFVMEMSHHNESAIIVQSVIDLGHNLRMKVVAEGVENQETWNLLADMGCDMAQGFHLSPPIAGAEVFRWVRDASMNAECQQ